MNSGANGLYLAPVFGAGFADCSGTGFADGSGTGFADGSGTGFADGSGTGFADGSGTGFAAKDETRVRISSIRLAISHNRAADIIPYLSDVSFLENKHLII